MRPGKAKKKPHNFYDFLGIRVAIRVGGKAGSVLIFAK